MKSKLLQVSTMFSTSPNFIHRFELVKYLAKLKEKKSGRKKEKESGLWLFLFREYGPMGLFTHFIKIFKQLFQELHRYLSGILFILTAPMISSIYDIVSSIISIYIILRVLVFSSFKYCLIQH